MTIPFLWHYSTSCVIEEIAPYIAVQKTSSKSELTRIPKNMRCVHSLYEKAIEEHGIKTERR